MGPMDRMIVQPSEISSALRCRLSEAEAPEKVDAEAQHRHLLLQGIAQDVELEAQPTRKSLFRRSR